MSQLRFGRLAAAAAAVVLLAMIISMISLGTEATPMRKMGNGLLHLGPPIIPTDPMPPPPRAPPRNHQAMNSPAGHEINVNEHGGRAAVENAPSGRVSETFPVMIRTKPN
ncbi:unnamed protein product [Urochloa humidicola]